MPRNVTITFDDGTKHVYKNAPDDITPRAVYDRAAKEFSGKKIVNVDGGRSGAAAQPDRTVGQYLGETAGNIVPSGAAMLGGMYEAITNPIQTAKGLGLAAYGGARNVAEATLPTSAFDVVKSVENPEFAKQAVDVANAIGGVYKNRYGSVNQLLDTIRTDPVGAAADLSLIFSGGAAATTKLPMVSGALRTAARVADPVAEAVGRTIGGTARLGAAGINRLTTSAETRFLNELAAGRGQELAQVARTAPRYPGVTPTFAEATTEVPVPRVQAFGKKAEEVRDVEAEVGARAKRAKMLEDLKTISKTPKDRADMERARDAKANEDYGKAFAKTVEDDDALRALFKRPAMQRAVDVAFKVAAERNEPFALGVSKPQQVLTDPFTGEKTIIPATNAEFSVENLHRVKMALDGIVSKPQDYGIAGEELRAINDTRKQFIGWLEDKVPEYKDARQNYAKASKELARADWGDFAVQKLTSAMKEDAPFRARNFANAVRESLGPNAPATLKRAIGGGSRYDDLTKLLTKDEMKIVSDVVAQLGREEMAAGMAQRGATTAPKLEKFTKTSKIQVFDQMWTLAQAAYGAIAGRLGEAKKAKVALAMLNADTMADLMERAAKKQARVETVTTPIRKAGAAAQATVAGPVGTAAGRFETEANRNAFLTDALGRSYDVKGNVMAR